MSDRPFPPLTHEDDFASEIDAGAAHKRRRLDTGGFFGVSRAAGAEGAEGGFRASFTLAGVLTCVGEGYRSAREAALAVDARLRELQMPERVCNFPIAAAAPAPMEVDAAAAPAACDEPEMAEAAAAASDPSGGTAAADAEGAEGGVVQLARLRIDSKLEVEQMHA